MTISSLIDKSDTVELIRDQVAAILVLESASQQALATAAGKDPELWALKVYKERANIWDGQAGPTPIVNVFWDRSTFDRSSSNAIERQRSSATIQIDCIGYGHSADSASGHTLGDQQAAETAQRAVRLVRNILCAATYSYLGLRGVVWGTWVESITIMQPPPTRQNAQHVVGARLSLTVDFNEFSPQVEPARLDLLTVGIHRQEDGQLIVAADYVY
jgi:hypothetical protein